MRSYNTIELRYADMELSKGNFVREEDYEKLEEEVKILRAERTYWYDMHNQATAPVNEMLDQ